MAKNLLFIPFSIFLFISCTSNKGEEQIAFYYYPEKNVYYNTSTQKYFYSLNGAKNWDSLEVFTRKEPVTLGDKVTVYSSAPDVWKQNAEHRRTHNGILYNVIPTNNASFASSSTDEVTERKVIKKAPPTRAKKEKQTATKDEKKGVKKFFENIFGKSKKEKK